MGSVLCTLAEPSGKGIPAVAELQGLSFVLAALVGADGCVAEVRGAALGFLEKALDASRSEEVRDSVVAFASSTDGASLIPATISAVEHRTFAGDVANKAPSIEDRAVGVLVSLASASAMLRTVIAAQGSDILLAAHGAREDLKRQYQILDLLRGAIPTELDGRLAKVAVRTMDAFPKNLKAQMSGCSALHACASSAASGALLGIQCGTAVTRALQFCKLPAVQGQCWSILRALCLSSSDSREDGLYAADVCAAGKVSLAAPAISKRPGLLEDIIAVMDAVAGRNQEALSTVQAAGIAAAVLEAAEKRGEGPGMSAAQALQRRLSGGGGPAAE